MNEKPRSPRRRFDSSSLIPKEDFYDLPAEPLPAEQSPRAITRPPADAPIVLIPIGSLDDEALQAAVPSVSQAFGRQVVLSRPLPVPKYAYNPTREQYHSAAILKRVESLIDDAWGAAIGIADIDLFVPEVPFVFGEADRSTRSAVISMVRLRSDVGTPEARSDSLAKRLAAEIIHQMGLIRGLAHCPNNRCVMFLSTTVQDTDKKGRQFCANCRKRLAQEPS